MSTNGDVLRLIRDVITDINIVSRGRINHDSRHQSQEPEHLISSYFQCGRIGSPVIHGKLPATRVIT